MISYQPQGTPDFTQQFMQMLSSNGLSADGGTQPSSPDSRGPDSSDAHVSEAVLPKRTCTGVSEDHVGACMDMS